VTRNEQLIDLALHDLALRRTGLNSYDVVGRVLVRAGLAQESVHTRRAAKSYAQMVVSYLDHKHGGDNTAPRPRSQSRYLSAAQKVEIYLLATLVAFRLQDLHREIGTPVRSNIGSEAILELVDRPDVSLLQHHRPRLSGLATVAG
jgi:hypothetical protein